MRARAGASGRIRAVRDRHVGAGADGRRLPALARGWRPGRDGLDGAQPGAAARPARPASGREERSGGRAALRAGGRGAGGPVRVDLAEGRALRRTRLPPGARSGSVAQAPSSSGSRSQTRSASTPRRCSNGAGGEPGGAVGRTRPPEPVRFWPCWVAHRPSTWLGPPLADLCGDCRRASACPTGALPAPYRLTPVVSLLTIEHRGEVARSFVRSWPNACSAATLPGGLPWNRPGLLRPSGRKCGWRGAANRSGRPARNLGGRLPAPAGDRSGGEAEGLPERRYALAVPGDPGAGRWRAGEPGRRPSRRGAGRRPGAKPSIDSNPGKSVSRPALHGTPQTPGQVGRASACNLATR
jgi:hypothetical protein